MRFDRRVSLQGFFGAIATLVLAGPALALPSQGVELVVRHATEPSTGSMVVAALVVIATVRRNKTRSH